MQILAGGIPGDHGGQLRQILIPLLPQRRLLCVFPAMAARMILAGGLLNVPNRPLRTSPENFQKNRRGGRPCPPMGSSEFTVVFLKKRLFQRADRGVRPDKD